MIRSLVQPRFTEIFGAFLTLRITTAAAIVALFAAGPRSISATGLSLSARFAAASDDGVGVPPDPQGAAGPDHLLVMLNTTFLAQRKDGSAVRSWTPAAFWAPISGGDLLFDPRVTYDGLSGRWIAVMATEGVTAAPAVLLAVSSGPDPTQGWSFQKLAAGNGDYGEFPLIGYNGRWIVVTSNLVSGSSGYLAGTAIWAIEKAPLLTEGRLSVTRFTLSTPGSPVAPVVTFDADQPDEFLTQEASGNDGGHGRLRLLRVTDSGGSASLAPAKILTAPATWSDFPNPIDSLPQAGTTRRITSDQDEVSSACLRNGMIWAVQTATLPAGVTPAHTVIQWWRIHPEGALDGFGRIGDPAGSTWLGFPSIAVNAEGQVLIGYSIFSPDRFASAGYSQSDCGGDAALSEIHTLKDGEAPYERPDAGGHNRWGDLSETVVDPSDDLGMWTLQEYAAPKVDGKSRWGTWWGEFAEASANSRGGACVAPVGRSAPARVGPGGRPQE